MDYMELLKSPFHNNKTLLNNKIELLIKKHPELIYRGLGQLNFKGEPYYQLQTHLEFFRNLYKQMAFHEYGHTFLIKSSSTMPYPKEILDFLKERKAKTFKDLVPGDHVEFQQLLYQTEHFQRDQKLKNFKYIDVVNGVCECHANYSVLTKLRKETPVEQLRFTKVDLVDGLHDYSNFDLTSIKQDYLNRRVIGWIVKSGDLLIFDKWQIIDKYVEKYGFKELSKFAYELNTKFLEIAKSDDDLEVMKKEMLKLAEETDKLNFREMFFT